MSRRRHGRPITRRRNRQRFENQWIARIPWWQAGLGVASALFLAIGIFGFQKAARTVFASSAFDVKVVKAKGLTQLSEEEVVALSGIEIGERWWDLDETKIRSELRTHPWIHDVRVKRPWPGHVRLVVAESDPIARIEVAGKEYGLCSDLRIVPGVEEDPRLPLIRAEMEEVALERAAAYATAAQRLGITVEAVEVVLRENHPDKIRLPKRGFSASVEDELAPEEVVENVSSFLETLDEKGGFRGTLRLLSKETAVWEAAA